MPEAACHIGTSGWNYRHWANGRFYPAGLKPVDWLPFLAQRFDTVEVNYSFYRVPLAKTVVEWQQRTPSYFLFALKLWRGITHYRKLHDAGELLKQYLAVVNSLEPSRRGPLLVQLPPFMAIDLPRLDSFLQGLTELTVTSPWRIAVEFRSPGWLVESTYRLLDRHGAALVLADLGKCPITEPNDVNFVYIRRHGGSKHPHGRYRPEEIDRDADRIRTWQRQNKAVFVYYNNDLHGHALDNAQQLRDALHLAHTA